MPEVRASGGAPRAGHGPGAEAGPGSAARAGGSPESGERSPPTRPLLLGSGLFLVLALVAVALALAGGWANWQSIDGARSGSSWQVRPGWLAASLAYGVAALLGTSAIWATLFRAAGGRTGTVESAAAWLGSNLGRYLPGKIWQLTSLAAYMRGRGDSGAAALAVSLSLQAVMLATGAALGVAALGPTALGAAGVWPLALGAVAIAAALSPPVLKRLVRLGQRLLREERDTQIPLGGGRLALAAAGGLVVWGLYGLGFRALLEGLVAGSSVGIVSACGVFAAGYVAGYVVLIAPGGVVVREGAIAGLLGAVAGMPIGPAAAVALAARIWTSAAELLAFAGAAGLGLRRRARGP